MPDRLDGRVRAELLPQPAHADVDDVRPRIEVVAPHLGQQALAADHLARVQKQVMEEPELAVGEIGDELAEPCLPAREVEDDGTGAQRVLVPERRGAAQLDANPGEQLVEGERLRQVVGGAELEPAQLRLQVGAGGEDDHRQMRPRLMQLAQHLQAGEARQEQVQHDEIPAPRRRQLEPVPTVVRGHDGVTLCFESTREKCLDPRLVLDHKDPHRPPILSPPRGPTVAPRR